MPGPPLSTPPAIVALASGAAQDVDRVHRLGYCSAPPPRPVSCMLFNSNVFIFLFLPTTVLLYHLLSRIEPERLPILFLAAASIAFYGYWEWRFVPVLLVSIAGNYAFARRIALTPQGPGRRLLAGVAIGLNLAALFYFKYMNFFVDTWNDAFGTGFVSQVVLPIGISFFTFQQIAYIVDTCSGRTADRDFARYALFVAFFPQLIAGPIVHHREMMPQLAAGRFPAWRRNLPVGATIFILGLAKKVLIADNLAAFASPVFDAAAAGEAIAAADAWAAALAYTFQIYFDFSGYSDMAIGLGWMFGVRLPMNFASPYKARSIVDFWRRWHLTLSRFLRDYLYIPLGGRERRYVNVFVTMLLGGIWHGAGWTFVLWGAMHGLMIVVDQAWSARRGVAVRPDGRPDDASGGWRPGRVAVTFLLVLIAWVPFRAADMGAVAAMYTAMAGLSDAAGAVFLADAKQRQIAALAIACAIAFFAPNTAQFMRRVRPVLPLRGYPATEIDPRVRGRLAWAPTAGWAVVMAVLFSVVVLNLAEPSAFIYFQF
ncbi:MAG: MBOAT family O-acyltransferase [Alphaproteobacteria bacterium]